MYAQIRFQHPASFLNVGLEHAIIQLDNRADEPVKLRWLVSTLPQDSPIRDGTLNTQRALQKTHVSHLQITRHGEDLILFN
jgi:hypothetical protein